MIIVELVRGGTLADQIETSGLPELEAWAFFGQLIQVGATFG